MGPLSCLLQNWKENSKQFRQRMEYLMVKAVERCSGGLNSVSASVAQFLRETEQVIQANLIVLVFSVPDLRP